MLRELAKRRGTGVPTVRIGTVVSYNGNGTYNVAVAGATFAARVLGFRTYAAGESVRVEIQDGLATIVS